MHLRARPGEASGSAKMEGRQDMTPGLRQRQAMRGLDAPSPIREPRLPVTPVAVNTKGVMGGRARTWASLPSTGHVRGHCRENVRPWARHLPPAGRAQAAT